MIKVRIELPDLRIGNGYIDENGNLIEIKNTLLNELELSNPESYFISIIPNQEKTIKNFQDNLFTVRIEKILNQENFKPKLEDKQNLKDSLIKSLNKLTKLSSDIICKNAISYKEEDFNKNLSKITELREEIKNLVDKI